MNAVPLHVWNKCQSKRGYKDWRLAELARKKLTHKGERGLHSYECPICGLWHVGHREKKD